MALSQCRSFLQFPICCGSPSSYNPKSNSSLPVRGRLSSLQIRTTSAAFLGPVFPFNQTILIPHRRCRNSRQFIIELRATENDSQESESITTAARTHVEEESSGPSSSDGGHRGEGEFSDIGDEIKKIRQEKSGGGGGGLSWGAVTEEIGQIEWPEFEKVIRTTGVVLAVIAGSSVVLLTVNAVLAELSDRVFAGRGIQDFFH